MQHKREKMYNYSYNYTYKCEYGFQILINKQVKRSVSPLKSTSL